MNISLILAHPDPKSFNHAIAKTAAARIEENGHALFFHDLYAESFDPILPAEEVSDVAELPPVIEKHCAEISSAAGIVVVHPNWWGQPPAILKGWVDRVIRPQVAYRFLEGDAGEGIPEGLLKAHSAVVFNTANTPMEREHAVFGDPLERIWKDCVFDLCGVRDFHRDMFTMIVTSTTDQRREWLNRVNDVINSRFPK